MIKSIKRLLEVGEETKESDLLYALESYSNRWEELGVVSKASNRPISRETLVLELPPIPEGFRLLTKEDKTNKLKGTFRFLKQNQDMTFEWSASGADKSDEVGDNFFYIIKPKQKGFTIKDIARGMTFYLDGYPYSVHAVTGVTITLEKFGIIDVEILNKHFSYENDGEDIEPCSEYQG